MVLPAGGVTLILVLVMTVLLPPFDNARSYRSMVHRIAQQVPAGACIAAPGMARAQVVALEYFGRYRVDAVAGATDTRCEFLMLTKTPKVPAAPWQFIGRERRLRADDDVTDIYRRVGAG